MHFECIPIHNTVKIFLRQKLCVFITHGLKHGEDKTQEKELKKKIKFCMKENGEDSKMRSFWSFFEIDQNSQWHHWQKKSGPAHVFADIYLILLRNKKQEERWAPGSLEMLGEMIIERGL